MRQIGAKLRADEGAILITVMLTVAMMATIAVLIIEQLRFSIRLTNNIEISTQARWYALGTEKWAENTIREWRNPGNDSTATGSNSYAQTSFKWAEISIVSKLVPQPNCFNLNSLVGPGDDGALQIAPKALRQYQNILLALGFSESKSSRLAAATADWIDPDSVAIPDGAEDYEYSGLIRPHRTGNTALVDVSELRTVKGYTSEVYERVRPYVCTNHLSLPSTINVNTLSKKQWVLLSMFVGVQDARNITQKIITARPMIGYDDPEGIWALAEFSDVAIAEDDKQNLTTNSRFYWLLTEVSSDPVFVAMTSVFDIDAQDKPAFVRRTFGVGF